MTTPTTVQNGYENIQVEKNVPIPPRNGNMGSKFAHVVRALEVGDSFWIAKASVGKGFPAAIRTLCRTIGIKAIVRTSKEKPTVGLAYLENGVA